MYRMTKIATRNPNFHLRFASATDAALIVQFMKKLGRYQKMEDEITATPASIERLLTEKLGEAVFGVYDDAVVSFIFYNQTSSAFTGRSGLFIDGFFVDQAMRHQGLGRIMMDFMCRHALDRGGQMVEWVCLDWNQPSIDFYLGLGAYCLEPLRTYRLSPDTMAQNGARF